MDLPDRDLLVELKRLVERERHATAALVASLAEVDARRLFLGEGCASLFVYCTRLLHLSESAAYARIAAARAGRRFPIILELLAAGEVSLTTVCLLAPHLTDDNHRGVLDTARHKGKREAEQLVAALHPQPDVVSTTAPSRCSWRSSRRRSWHRPSARTSRLHSRRGRVMSQPR